MLCLSLANVSLSTESLRTYKVVVTTLDICMQFNLILVISEWFFIIECNVIIVYEAKCCISSSLTRAEYVCLSVIILIDCSFEIIGTNEHIIIRGEG